MESLQLLSSEQARDLARIAEQAWKGLSRFAGHEVAYDATALQLLDEWIDHHLQQSSNPSRKMRLLWVSFLGEMFRRRHDGRWVIQRGDSRGLAVVCPVEGGGYYPVDVSGQIDRRIAHGMADSLAYFYNVTRIELKIGQ